MLSEPCSVLFRTRSVSASPSTVLQLGSSATLQCQVKGLPSQAALQWRKPDGSLHPGSDVARLEAVACSDEGAWNCTFSHGGLVYSERLDIKVTGGSPTSAGHQQKLRRVQTLVSLSDPATTPAKNVPSDQDKEAATCNDCASSSCLFVRVAAARSSLDVSLTVLFLSRRGGPTRCDQQSVPAAGTQLVDVDRDWSWLPGPDCPDGHHHSLVQEDSKKESAWGSLHTKLSRFRRGLSRPLYKKKPFFFLLQRKAQSLEKKRRLLMPKQYCQCNR